MKTIFRYTNIAVLLAALLALGAVAGMAQNPCEDAEGITTLGDKFRADFALKTLDGRKSAIDTGKQFLEKYGACDSAKDLVDYLKVQIPKMEEAYKKAVAIDIENKLVARFNLALNSKSWDDVYVSGKELLANYGDKYLDVELALGTIGYDESYNNNNFKYNDDTLKYAKQSIADIEGGKTFSANYGVPKNYVYKSKDNALGWMNLFVGYITQTAKKDKKAAQPYLFKATQAASETNKNPIPFQLIGEYYFDELNKLTVEITEMIKNQPPDTAAPEAIKAAADAIKAKVALSNGTSERALDAFSRAYTFGAAKPYKDKMHKNIEDAYKLRFAKGNDGLEAWIADTIKKPFVNPTTPVTPISDPEPVETVKTTGGTGIGNANGTGIGNANGTGIGNANGTGVGGTTPASNTTTVKPATTPAKPITTKKPITKPQAVVKKRVVKKKGV